MSAPENNPFADKNPYAAPTAYGQGPVLSSSGLSLEMSKLVKDFRAQSLALGVAWCIFGVLAGAALVVFVALPMNNQMQGEVLLILMVILGLTSVGWLASGVGTLMKQVWGIYVGLVMSYLALVGNVLNFNLCGLVIIILILVQAHRVLTFANRMKAAGIPLDAQP